VKRAVCTTGIGLSRLLGFFVFIFAISAFALDPQKRITQFAHQSWGAADGLDQVYSIAQTTDGYIWVAAANGLFQFDGIHFRQWEAKPGETRLPSHPNKLLGAKDGSLWIGSMGHMLRLQNWQLEDYILPGAASGQNTNGIQERRGGWTRIILGVQERRDGIIWAATSFGLFQFTQGQWQRFELPETCKDGGVPTLVIGRDDTVWAAIVDPDKPCERILFLRPGDKHFRTLFEVVNSSFLAGNLVSLAESPDAKVWLSTLSSIRVVSNDPRSPHFINQTIEVLADKACFDRDGNLWMSWYGNGLARLNSGSLAGTNNVSKEDVKDRFTPADGFSSDYVNCLFEDREGNIWIGTTGGLDCFSEVKVTALSHREGLPYDANLSIQATSDGNIWAFSTLQGLEKIDPQRGQFTAKGWSPFALRELSSGYCLYADKDTDVFVGTSRGLGLIRNGVMSQFELPDRVALSRVTAITRDRAGGLWLCDHDKGVLCLLDNELQKFPELIRARTEYVITAHSDSSGRVWLGYAYGGIVCWDKGQILRFTSQDGLFSGQVRTIFSDDRGSVWAAGAGGLSRFENGRFRTLTRDNGLRDDDIYAVLEDDDQCFWIAGVHGVFRVTRAKLEQAIFGTIQTVDGELFETKDGIRGIVHHAPTGTAGLCYTVATKSPDGKLWFSTSGGLAVVDPKHIFKNQIPPAVHIEQIIAAGKTNRAFDGLHFPKGTRDCEIDYAGLSFINPLGVRYEYKLEGYDKDWVKADTRRQAFYSNLRPKTYRFRVRARNSDGVCSEKDGEVGFIFAPEFYETTWFPYLCVISAALGIFAMHRLRLARLASRMNLQLAIQLNERKRIAQELHDTLLQGFTGVGLKLDTLVSSLPASLNATRLQFQKSLELLDQYLTEGRRSIWKLRSPALESAEGFCRAIEKASQRAVAGTSTTLSFSVRGQERELQAFIEDNLLRICEEAVANAVKHARPTRVEVTLEFNSKHVQLKIRDNGSGFDTNQVGSSKDGHFGLIGIQERVKGMGGRSLLTSQCGKGTEVAVTVPIG
jgi:signal transduction histidine kinase/ligand-binding sensor domain-containing protein